MSGEGGAIAEVLAAHLIGYEPRAYPAYVCYCGWDGAQGDDGSESDGQHDNAAAANEHVAAALLASPALADLLAAERQRGREEALREAAVTDCGLTYSHDPHVWRTQRGKAKACDGANDKRSDRPTDPADERTADE